MDGVVCVWYGKVGQSFRWKIFPDPSLKPTGELAGVAIRDRPVLARPAAAADGLCLSISGFGLDEGIVWRLLYEI